MPEIEIELEPIAEGQAELPREIGQLEAEGKRILDIRYPGWAAASSRPVPSSGESARCIQTLGNRQTVVQL
jgi:hypothetical protein